MKEKKYAYILCDISNACYGIWHKGLLNKLENIVIQCSLLLWIKYYLKGRKQRVVIESAHSNNSLKIYRRRTQHNGQKKRYKRTINNTHKTKDRVTRTPLKLGVNPSFQEG